MTAALSEHEALAFSIDHRRSLGNLAGNYLEAPKEIQAKFKSRIVDALVSVKGMITDQMSDAYRWAAEVTDPVAAELMEDLRSTHGDLANQYVLGPSNGPEEFRELIDSMQAVIEGCESRLMQVSTRYSQRHRQLSVSADELAELVPANAWLIEYLRVDIPSAADPETYERAYLALVINRGSETTVRNLGPACAIDSLTDELYRHMREIASMGKPSFQDKIDYATIASPLANLVLDPMIEDVPEDGLLIFAPDGTLNTVSFATLTTGKDEYLVETNDIHYVSAGRDLLNVDLKKPPCDGRLALGDPDFNAIPDTLMSSALAVTEATASDQGAVMRQSPGDCDGLKDLLASPLPSTTREIRAITDSWAMHQSSPPLILTGSQANEANFKRNATDRKVIHIATHGFFVEQSCAGEDTVTRNPDRLTVQSDNPLLFSGLLLAGANRRLFEQTRDESVEDGLLTALEVSTLNLTGTELVVLSACETGLGTVEDGEGLFGLKRAFHLAGSATVVSSLWSVPDNSTAAFMGSLYASNEDSLPARLRGLQLDVIETLRAAGDTDHPFTWGAFTIQGDWRGQRGF